jgi:acyl-coenzyme A thioesterase PaaI-like protein
MSDDTTRPLPARMGIRPGAAAEGVRHLTLVPFPALCAAGVVRISVWALMADMVGGWTAEGGTGPDWVFTTDLSVRAPVRRIPERVVATANLLRVGAGNVATDVHLQDERGHSFAYAQLGFARMPRRPGDPPRPDMGSAEVQRRWNRPDVITRPLADEAGCVVVDPARGRVEVELTDELRNPAGAMQGAMVALVGEVAAETLASHHLGAPQVVTDLDVRFLAMGRVGPVWTHATFIGAPTDATIRVELRDRGNGDRLITAFLARTAPAPGGAERVVRAGVLSGSARPGAADRCDR